MKKITTLLTAITLMLLTGCGPVIYRHSSSTSEEPSINVLCNNWWESGVKYTVSATGYGTLCSGNGYSDKSEAIAHPLEIQSAGYEIVVTLVDDSTEIVTMVAGDTELICCESGLHDHGYLYVIIV